jgi:hypothetical protein
MILGVASQAPHLRKWNATLGSKFRGANRQSAKAAKTEQVA